MRDRPLSAIVLAAGEGTRMRSTRPKPLHLLCGRAMLLYVLDALGGCATKRVVVVVGHGAERVTKKLQEDDPPYLLVGEWVPYLTVVVTAVLAQVHGVDTVTTMLCTA